MALVNRTGVFTGRGKTPEAPTHTEATEGHREEVVIYKPSRKASVETNQPFISSLQNGEKIHFYC